MDLKKAVKAYILLRSKVDERKKEHKAELKELTDKQAKIANLIQKQLDELGVDNIKTEDGTAFKAKKDSVTVKNKADFMEFVVNQVKESGADGLYMMSITANKNAVKEYMEEHEDELPPGVKYEAWTEVQVRKS